MQLFIKRLRKHLSKYTNERIRYYACGEYGPQHFRPHFHLLVWFDRTETFKAFNRCLYSAWRFGRISSEVSRGSCSKYVAQYLNSNAVFPRYLVAINQNRSAVTQVDLVKKVCTRAKKKYTNYPLMSLFEEALRSMELYRTFFLWRSVDVGISPNVEIMLVNLLEASGMHIRCIQSQKEWTDEISPLPSSQICPIRLRKWFHAFRGVSKITSLVHAKPKVLHKKIARCDKDMFEQMFRSIYHDLYIKQAFFIQCL